MLANLFLALLWGSFAMVCVFMGSEPRDCRRCWLRGVITDNDIHYLVLCLKALVSLVMFAADVISKALQSHWLQPVQCYSDDNKTFSI